MRPGLTGFAAAALAAGLLAAGPATAHPQAGGRAAASAPVPAGAAADRPGAAPTPPRGGFAGVPGLAGMTMGAAAPAGMTEHHLWVDGRDRWYLLHVPAGGRSGPRPVLVILHGRGMAPAAMATMSGFGRAAPAAVLVYPAGVSGSWNAGACCGPARVMGVDDVRFLKAVIARVVATVPHADRRAVYVVGYSNGGRLAYRMACEAPASVAGVAAVEAAPVAPCPLGHGPVPLLVVGSTGDPLVRLGPGRPPQVINGFAVPALADVVAEWRGIDGCGPTPVVRSAGSLASVFWSRCSGGARVGFDVYSANGHSWPRGRPGTPAADQEISAFFGVGPASA